MLEVKEEESDVVNELSDSKKKSKKSRRKKVNSHSKPIDFHESRRNLIRVSNSSSKGRCLVAMQKITEGTLVYREGTKAIIGYDNQICTNCSNTVNKVIHDEFHPFAIYCSPYCEEVFRNRRDFEVSIAMMLPEIATTCNCDQLLLRMILRILSWAFIESKIGQVPEQLLMDNGISLHATYQGFLNLEPHIELQTSEWKHSIETAAERILPLIPPDTILFQVEDILKIAARINTNAYGCQNSDGSNRYVGFGVFPVIGMTINHDCYPNCFYSFINGQLECRVIRTVAKDEELTVNYIDLIETFANRRAELMQKRHFECSCQRCQGSLTFGNVKQSSERSIDADFGLFDVSITSGYPDALLAGIYCERCGPTGVVSSPALPDPANEVALACHQCGFQVAQGKAHSLLTDAQDLLQVHMREAAVWKTSNPAQAVEGLDKWFRVFDPSATAAAGSVTPQTVGRKYGGLKLHPSHKLIMEANIAVSNYLEAAGDQMRSLSCLRRAVATVQLVVTEHFPELANLRLELANKIQRLLQKGGLAAKAKQALVKEASELQERVRASRLVAFGESHPINQIAVGSR